MGLFVIFLFIVFLILIGGALFWFLMLNNVDLFQKGVDYYQNGNYEKAKKLFLLAVSDNPASASAKYNLGITHVALKEYEEAKTCFEQALAIQPKDLHSRYNLGLVHFNLENYTEAKKWFEKSLEIDSNDFNSLFNLALTYHMQKDYNAAIEFYNKALIIDEKDVDCYYNLGLAHFEKKDYIKAKELFDQALTLDSNRTDILFGALRCKEELTDYESLEQGHNILDEYVEISKRPGTPVDFDAFLARAYAKVGQLDAALEICDRAVLNNPTEPLLYRVIGLIKLVRNELDEAKKALKRAVNLDSYNPDGYHLLSYVCFQENNQLEYVTYKTKYEELMVASNVNEG
jgi:tetratricopeptide (TPR) repeat protein